MKQIKLTQGQVALVDDVDFEYLNQWKWYALYYRNTQSFYAVRSIVCDGRRTTIKMHRVILGLTDRNIKCDHRNHNTLDNQRSNLRTATHSENASNQSSKKNSTSKFLGAYWHKATNKWAAHIRKNGVGKHLGVFKNEEDAAKAYDNAAIKLHGEFANLNFKTA